MAPRRTSRASNERKYRASRRVSKTVRRAMPRLKMWCREPGASCRARPVMAPVPRAGRVRSHVAGTTHAISTSQYVGYLSRKMERLRARESETEEEEFVRPGG